ncbi:MAG: rhodanese-like domain-containing protein [Candidatus Kapaibacteriota bacterium]|jgi:phage shock protein E
MDKNIIYILLIAGAIALVFFKGTLFGSSNVKSINSAEAKELIKKGKVELIDVRTPAEVSAGYIKGTKIFADYMGNDFKAKTAKLDKSKTYLVYCKSGGRSAKASSELTAAGFTNIINLSGGISSWDGEISK